MVWKRLGSANTGARARLLLAIGAGGGLALAAGSLLSAPGGGDALPPGAVARVNHQLIRSEEYLRVLGALASDRREPLEAADRERVLARLIDEELLVQHAVSLGLLESDRRVRSDLVSAVLGAVAAAADAYEPAPAEVEAFYAENREYFAGPGRLWVRQVFVPVDGDGEQAALRRAERVAERLRAGEAFERVRAELGAEPVAPLPDTGLPPGKLREYLGPTALRSALDLSPGGTSAPIRSAQGYHVLRLVAREAGGAPPLAEIEAQVRAEMRRREGDRALRERLDQLRARADVTVAPKLP